MKRNYEIQVHYEGNITINIRAETEEEAKDIAESKFEDVEDLEIIANIEQISAKIAEEVE